MTESKKCSICGEPMPDGETMFNFHGYSGPCPKPPLLQPHQRRVVGEKTELDAKAKALQLFILDNPIYATLDAAEQELLSKQNGFMWQYSNVLAERIAAFK